MKLSRGLVHIYTGDGKGKTTAALGLGFRAAGHGLKVLVIQFKKGRINYGELQSAKKMGRNFRIIQSGRETFVDLKNPDPVDVGLAENGYALAEKHLKSGSYDLVVLDEIICALMFKLLTERQILKLLRLKPRKTELVLTGRGATPGLKKAADLVTEMKEIKHYYRKNIQGRMGIEW